MTEIEEKDRHFIIRMTKAVLVLTRDEFRAGVVRGKWWQRHGTMTSRMARAKEAQNSKSG